MLSAVGVRMERGKERVAIHRSVGSNCVAPLGSVAIDSVRVGIDALPQSKHAVNIHVVHPERWIVRCHRNDGHVALMSRLRSTNVVVNVVMDIFESFWTLGWSLRRITLREAGVVVTLSHDIVDARPQAGIIGLQGIRCTLIVIGRLRGGVGRITQGDIPVVPRIPDHARMI